QTTECRNMLALRTTKVRDILKLRMTGFRSTYAKLTRTFLASRSKRWNASWGHARSSWRRMKIRWGLRRWEWKRRSARWAKRIAIQMAEVIICARRWRSVLMSRETILLWDADRRS